MPISNSLRMLQTPKNSKIPKNLSKVKGLGHFSFLNRVIRGNIFDL
jgi:hypothetical protein